MGLANRLLDPHLKAAVQAELNNYLGSFDSEASTVTVTWYQALKPYQPGTVLCPCFDTTGNRTTDPADPRCYGRGVLGGYAPGVLVPVALILGQTREVQNPEGYLQTEDGAICYIQEPLVVAQPLFQRDDLLVAIPDPLAVPGSPDRRYIIADTMDPVHVLGHTFARRYWCTPAELGSVVYRVPAPSPNTIPIPPTQHGTI